MEKPITLVREDLIQNISNVINESKLPPFVVEPILQNILLEVRTAMQRQYEVEKDAYAKALQEKDTSDSV